MTTFTTEDRKQAEKRYTCSTCACEFTDGEGGTTGHFGIIPVAFCPYCLASIMEIREGQEDT